jgi:Na+-transporting methylmalonyl-CoA/oxaloacetate decarboxylase gamma subunit
MIVGMGTVGAFLTTMVLVMYLTAAVLKGRFPDKPKSPAKKSKTKKKTATATKKAVKDEPAKKADDEKAGDKNTEKKTEAQGK